MQIRVARSGVYRRRGGEGGGGEWERERELLTAIIASQAPRVEVLPSVFVRYLLNFLPTLLTICGETGGGGGGGGER